MPEGSQLASSKWILYPEVIESERDIIFRFFEAILLHIDYCQDPAGSKNVKGWAFGYP